MVFVSRKFTYLSTYTVKLSFLQRLQKLNASCKNFCKNPKLLQKPTPATSSFCKNSATGGIKNTHFFCVNKEANPA